RQSAFLTIHDLADVLCNLVNGPKSIHPVIATGLPVVLDEREGFFPVNFKPFEDQLLTIIGPANQRHVASVARTGHPWHSAHTVIKLAPPETHHPADQTGQNMRILRPYFDHKELVGSLQMLLERFRLGNRPRVT